MLERFGENLPAREVKFAPCDLKRVEADGTFAGYASLFGEVDLGQDLVMPGAFRESLGARGTQGVKLLFQHDPNEPIGVWLELYEDAKGLFARGRLMPEVSQGVWLIGVVSLAFGLGFIISGVISYVLSRRMGLLDPVVPPGPSTPAAP